jgi:hypothetical protein
MLTVTAQSVRGHAAIQVEGDRVHLGRCLPAPDAYAPPDCAVARFGLLAVVALHPKCMHWCCQVVKGSNQTALANVRVALRGSAQISIYMSNMPLYADARKLSRTVHAPFRDVAPADRLPCLCPTITGRKVDDWIERMLHPKQRYVEPGQLLIGAPYDERHSKSDNLSPPAK